MRGNDGGRESYGVDHESPGVGDEEGGHGASGVAEIIRGSRQGVGGGVDSPQGANTPVVAELPQGDETPGGTTASKGGPREDGRGQGGGKNPTTTRETRAQGADGSDDGPMGGPRTAADNGSAENLSRHTAVTDGARPKHDALARHE